MTGFWSSLRGVSLTKESRTAERTIPLSKNLRRSGRARTSSSEELPGLHQEMLHDGTERKSGKERQCADDQDHADDEEREEGSGHRKGSGRGGDLLLGRQRPRDPEDRDQHEIAAEEHRHAERRVVPERVGVQPGERRPVVSGSRLFREESPCGSTDDAAENPRITTVRTRIESMASLTSCASIFLPRYSGVRPTMSPAMKIESTMKTKIP